MSEHRSQLLSDCREKNKTEEKALQDLRWKTNGESELSFNEEGSNSMNQSGINGKKNNKNGSKLGSRSGSILGGKQKSDHNDAMSFVSLQSDLKSRYSTKTFEDNRMLEIINHDIDLTDKQVVSLFDTLNDEKVNTNIKEDEIDDFFNQIRGGNDLEGLKESNSYFWEDKNNAIIQKEVFGDNRDNDFDMMDIDEVDIGLGLNSEGRYTQLNNRLDQ